MENINEQSIIEESIFGYIEGVFIGIEAKVFEMAMSKEDGVSGIKTREGMLYGINFVEYYLNQVYKSLIEKKDDFVVKQFDDLGGLIHNHPVYTLNLLSNVIMKCYPLLTRSKLNLESPEKYIESVREITQTMKKYIIQIFNDDLLKLSKAQKEQKENPIFNEDKENDNINQIK